ncbi:MAG: ATP-binding protein [Bacillota bacterium]|nr:ATP-binding protein [Bacillota bacterium]
MKCKVCKGEAFIKFPAHNAAFCEEHFDAFFIRQVEKAIRRYGMLSPGAGVMVAVSGGKDSLVVADVLSLLGYAVRGLHIDLGIDDNGFSAQSREVSASFFSRRGLPLQVLDLRETFGMSVVEAGRRFPRFCSLCGMTKRYLMNRTAAEAGVEALVTGHNLDDLASALLANVLRWDLRYLAKTLPVLPGENGFARKVKPLALLSEREIAAYAGVHAIQVVTARCPYSTEAKFLRFKRVLNDIEDQSPGTKRRFYEGYVDAAHLFQTSGGVQGGALRPCTVCGMPTSAEVCSFCKTWRGRR